MLTGHELKVGHELAWTLEAAQVAELGSDDHGGLGLKPTEAANPVDDGLVARGERQCLDPPVQVVPTLELVFQQREILPEHDPVLLGELVGLQDLTDPVDVAGGPVRSFPIDEAASAKEFEDIMSRLQPGLFTREIGVP